MRGALTRTGYITALGLVLIFAVIAFRGPQGVPALMEKRRQIQQLQQQNDALTDEIRSKREYLERLRTNSGEQELKIRERLKLLRENETSFILPEAPKEDAAKPESDSKPAEDGVR